MSASPVASQLFDPPTPKLTEAEMFARLRARYTSRAGNGPRWAFVTHVRNRAGWDGSRTLDAVVLDTWQSAGLALHGFEVKTSRADWLRELKQPWKAEAFTRYMDYFWIVAPRDAVKLDELPDGFGLLATRGEGLAAIRQAEKRTPEPVDRSFLACLMRAACYREAQLA